MEPSLSASGGSRPRPVADGSQSAASQRTLGDCVTLQRRYNARIARFRRLPTKFQFPRRLTVLLLLLAGVFIFAPLLLGVAGKSMTLAGWAMLSLFVICIVCLSIYIYRYSIIVGDEDLVVSNFTRKRFLLSNMTEIHVDNGRYSPHATIEFSNGDKISVPSYIRGFDKLVALVRSKLNLA
jgi:small-conductance mechanosensitive channel